MSLKFRVVKLEKRVKPSLNLADRLADRLANARSSQLSRPPQTKQELEAIAAHKPDSMAARLARAYLRLLAYDNQHEIS